MAPKPPRRPRLRSKKNVDPADEQSILNKLSSYLANPFGSKPIIKTPIEGCFERLINMFKNNFRGLIGVLVPLIVLLPQVQRFNSHVKLLLMWQWMFWFYLFHPIAVPCTSVIPVFLLPMAGIYDSLSTCKCYMTEAAMLYVTSAYLLVLLNNSGVDKRIGLWFLCCGESNIDQFSGKKLVLKASSAAFFLSIFSSRLIAAFNLTETITNTLEKLEPSNPEKGKKTSAVTEMRYVINNAIHTSASIGGLAVVHSSWVTLLFRACFQECQKVGYENPDIFNYFQYSAFAIPVAFAMFIVNLIYHIILMTMVENKGFSEDQTIQIRKTLLRYKAEIPKSISVHEMYSILFTILLLAALFTRHNRFMGGWATKVNFGLNPYIIRCKDTTVTAIFVIILHVIPKSFGFLTLFAIKKRKDLPHMKPESAVLWWRFVDKNVNYGYLFTIGSAVAILRAGNVTKLNETLISTIGMKITDLNWNVSLFVCILISAILCNVMTAMAACAIWLPYILLLEAYMERSVSDVAEAVAILLCFLKMNKLRKCEAMNQNPLLHVATVSVIPWPTHYYLPALGIGMACNLGFCTPFQYTPAYYCRHTGRVPYLKMVKYSIPSVLICIVILYGGLKSFATTLFDPDLSGIKSLPGDKAYLKLLSTVTTKKPETTPASGQVDAEPPKLML